MGLGVKGLKFKVQGGRFGGAMVCGLGLRVWYIIFRVEGFGTSSLGFSI